MSTIVIPIYEEVYQFLISSPTPQEIIDFRVSDETQNRVSVLLSKNRDGILIPDERSELDQFEQVNHLMSMMKIYARNK